MEEMQKQCRCVRTCMRARESQSEGWPNRNEQMSWKKTLFVSYKFVSLTKGCTCNKISFPTPAGITFVTDKRELTYEQWMDVKAVRLPSSMTHLINIRPWHSRWLLTGQSAEVSDLQSALSVIVSATYWQTSRNSVCWQSSTIPKSLVSCNLHTQRADAFDNTSLVLKGL